jgi:hypothetical protein
MVLYWTSYFIEKQQNMAPSSVPFHLRALVCFPASTLACQYLRPPLHPWIKSKGRCIVVFLVINLYLRFQSTKIRFPRIQTRNVFFDQATPVRSIGSSHRVFTSRHRSFLPPPTQGRTQRPCYPAPARAS